MTSLVSLLPPRRRDPRNIYAARSLPFVQSGAGRYAHRVRSFCVVNMHAPTFAPHSAASCWCGMTILFGKRHRGTVLLAEPTKVVCATCEGRAIGAGQIGTPEIAGRPVMFSPRRGEP